MALKKDVLKVEILDDGRLKTDASEALGDEAQIMELLKALAGEVTDDDPAQAVTVEAHTHKHGHAHIHHHTTQKAGH